VSSQFALPEPERVGAAIRLRPLWSTRSRCTHRPSPRSQGPETARLPPARRRLSAPWMLTLLTPSFHVGAGRAFTENVPTSDTLLSLCGTGASAPTSDRQLLPRTPLWSVRSRVSPQEPESSHRPLVLRAIRLEPDSPSREDGGTTQGAFDCVSYTCGHLPIRAAFQPHKSNVLRRRTEPRTMPPL